MGKEAFRWNLSARATSYCTPTWNNHWTRQASCTGTHLICKQARWSCRIPVLTNDTRWLWENQEDQTRCLGCNQASKQYPQLTQSPNDIMIALYPWGLIHSNASNLIMSQDKSPINFDKTIAGFNVTEHGIRSYTKSFRLGPFQLTLNARGSGVHGSISIPGTGLSKRNIKII